MQTLSLPLPPQQSNGGFRFPKWYSDYLNGNSRSGSLVVAGETPRSVQHRLTYLQADGSSSKKSKQKQKFPTLRNGNQPSSALPVSLPKLAIGRVPIDLEHQQNDRQQHQQLGISSLTERYNSFATVPEAGTLTHRRAQQQAALLYSNIRCSTRARLCDFNKLAPVTIPSGEDIRREFNGLPPISIKKLG